MKKCFQPFHLVTYSPWPLLTSFSLMNIMFGMINMLHKNLFLFLFLSLLMLMLCMYQWWRDIIRESTYQGMHTLMVIKSLKLGMILFILSELFFFLSIFWCYLHMYLSPSIEIGNLWPPKNISSFNPYMIPLLNTIILLCSGISITYCHYSLLKSMKSQSILSLSLTIFLGVIFTMFQMYEYMTASFTISDSTYGSIFFLSTGFHGLHVLIGTIFLLINLIRMIKLNFSKNHHLGFEFAAWYWHFVDVIWLFLYLLVYLLP